MMLTWTYFVKMANPRHFVHSLPPVACKSCKHYLRPNGTLNLYELPRCDSETQTSNSCHVVSLSTCNVFTLVFTALHGMQTRSSDEISVCLSIRPAPFRAKSPILNQ